MRQLDVSVVVLQDECSRALQNSGTSAGEPRGMTSANDRFAARLDTDKAHTWVIDERVEHSDSIAATADTGNDCVWQSTDKLQDLPACFAPNHRLKFADHQG